MEGRPVSVVWRCVRFGHTYDRSGVCALWDAGERVWQGMGRPRTGCSRISEYIPCADPHRLPTFPWHSQADGHHALLPSPARLEVSPARPPPRLDPVLPRPATPVQHQRLQGVIHQIRDGPARRPNLGWIAGKSNLDLAHSASNGSSSPIPSSALSSRASGESWCRGVRCPRVGLRGSLGSAPSGSHLCPVPYLQIWPAEGSHTA